MKFAVGQEVWVYDPPVMPRSAVVQTVNDTMGYKCRFEPEWAFWDNTSFSEHHLFARPEEWEYLVDRLIDDSETAARAADKIERKYGC